jgi:hypothetical protein
MGLYGHDTDLMNDWSKNLTNSNKSYADLIDDLYSLFGRFLNSPSFSGGLSEQLYDQTGDQKKRFLDYNDVIEECAKYVAGRANVIDDETHSLSQRAAADNPLG